MAAAVKDCPRFPLKKDHTWPSESQPSLQGASGTRWGGVGELGNPQGSTLLASLDTSRCFHAPAWADPAIGSDEGAYSRSTPSPSLQAET